jgi:hypothetical protein
MLTSSINLEGAVSYSGMEAYRTGSASVACAVRMGNLSGYH